MYLEIYLIEKLHIIYKNIKKQIKELLYIRVPIVWPGERVRSGQLLTENQDISDTEFNIGNNLNVVYGSYYGYEYEDALIISQKVLYKNIFTSIHFDIYETKYSKYPINTPEYSTLDLPKRSVLSKKTFRRTRDYQRRI